MSPTNRQRAERAMIVLMRYAARRFSPNRDTAIVDLLTDIGHFCDQEQLPFDQLVATAVDHWQTERQREVVS